MQMFSRFKKLFGKVLYPSRCKILIIFLIIILSMWVLKPWVGKNDSDAMKKCYNAGQNRLGEEGELEDILLSLRKPKPGKSIFFHETSCQLNANEGKANVKLNARQACAIESAALNNPNYDVFVIFASPTYRDNITFQPLLDTLLSYSNVYVRTLNLWTYAAGTPIFKWLKDGDLFHSRHVFSHVSDFLRYLTLYRWGGTYLDLDVVVKGTLENHPPNYSGAESDRAIAAGVMNFGPDGFGHEVAGLCLHDFQRNFDGNDWGNNGPGVITRVLQKICHTKSPQLMTRDRCVQFNVYPKDTFYAIRWQDWKYFFETKYLEETLNRTNNSIVVHVWNMHSKNRRIKVGSNVAYGKLAEKYCPKVYGSVREYF